MKNDSPNPMLICIPDISGFTEFMSEADFEMSSKVIPSLLNNIIYSNEIGLKVSEIEGDAVLFYKTGPLPPFQVLTAQCRYFYDEFYRKLKHLQSTHKKENRDLNIPKILGLKIILHYGLEVGLTQVGNRIKLLGEDIIIAHRLLKNEVPLDEYLLISKNLTDQYVENQIIDPDWGKFVKDETHYRHLGKIQYNYIGLNPSII